MIFYQKPDLFASRIITTSSTYFAKMEVLCRCVPPELPRTIIKTTLSKLAQKPKLQQSVLLDNCTKAVKGEPNWQQNRQDNAGFLPIKELWGLGQLLFLGGRRELCKTWRLVRWFDQLPAKNVAANSIKILGRANGLVHTSETPKLLIVEKRWQQSTDEEVVLRLAAQQELVWAHKE
jgi:hypothetical protein